MNPKVVVGKLYMNECSHCKMLEKPWSQMEHKIGGKIKVEKIESAEIEDRLAKLNQEYNSDVAVQGGFPTIFKIKNQKVEYYNGERTAPALIKWATKNQGNTKKYGGKKRRKTSKK
jgi:hypothetical protein